MRGWADGSAGGEVEVAILGPTVLSGAGGVVALPARTERAVIAALAARGDRIATASSLAADVWGEHDSADQRLVVTVSRLRRRMEQALGPPGRYLVETVPDGYRLAVERIDVDARRFAHLVAEGRAQLGRGDLALASATFDAALALWRGDPLTDLAPSPAVLAAVAGLTAARDAAVDASTETSLALGDNDAVIARVEALLIDDPYREARWAQLMRALYRAGRQADALRAFQRARQVLVDELGVEPGAELCRLEAEVLSHDPALDLRPLPSPVTDRGGRTALARSVVEARWVDHQREVARAGRDDELALLLDSWSVLAEGRGGVVLVEGDPGVGKTRLAAELAHLVMASGAEVLRAGCAPGAGLVALMPWAAALGFDVPDAQPGSPALASFAFEVADHLATVTDRPSTLLVLDDLQWADDQTVAFLTELGERPLPVPNAQRVLAVLLLQRGRDRPSGWSRLTSTMDRLGLHVRIDLDPLGGEDARSIVSAVLGPAATPSLVDRLVAEAGGNAQALVETARAARAAPPDEDDELPVPRVLLEAFAERLGREAPEVGAAVGAAAVIGDLPDVRTVATASALDDESALSALERAVTARLLDPAPGGGGALRFGFRFPLERRLAAAQVSTARRARIDERLGR